MAQSEYYLNILVSRRTDRQAGRQGYNGLLVALIVTLELHHFILSFAVQTLYRKLFSFNI